MTAGGQQVSYMYDLLKLYWEYVIHFFSFPFHSGNRLFFLYLPGFFAFGFIAYRFGNKWSGVEDQNPDLTKGNFLRYLFPKEVWSRPSAWLDMRYFFFHGLIGHFVIATGLVGVIAWAFALVTGGQSVAEQMQNVDVPTTGFWGDLLYMVVLFLILDLLGYFMHYLQHVVPVLWEFHKVHHSAEVMHPISNFREHPIDNFGYGLLIGVGHGIFIGLIFNILGFLPSAPTILGVPVFAFLFNFFGYHLRHSHIWLRWPGVWSKVFPSSAHHHVHHSRHPEHLDKNFAFMFPFWDVVFGTYVMPENNKDVEFGVLGMPENEMDTCAKLYWMPFQKAYRRARYGISEDPQLPEKRPTE